MTLASTLKLLKVASSLRTFSLMTEYSPLWSVALIGVNKLAGGNLYSGFSGSAAISMTISLPSSGSVSTSWSSVAGLVCVFAFSALGNSSACVPISREVCSISAGWLSLLALALGPTMTTSSSSVSTCFGLMRLLFSELS